MPESISCADPSQGHLREVPSPYAPRHPEDTLLHQIVREHLETFLARARRCDHPVPRFIERELRAYLECGILARGFLRLHCDACGGDRLVPFSCKGRICPSCAGRRMADTAAHLVDRVVPEVPVRQWVLSLPFALRYRLAYDARLTSEVLNLFLRTLFAFQRRRGWRGRGRRRAQCGAVTFVQRFGSAAANLNVHFHSLVLDGVYEVTDAGPIRFHPLPPPDDDEVARVVVATARRLARLLEARGMGPNADPIEGDPLAQEDPLLAALAAASLQGRVATGPRAGQRLRRLGDQVEPEGLAWPDDRPPPRCASAAGLSLHADVAVPARDRRRLERLARYGARPPLAAERLTKQGDGRLCYRLKHRWRDGTTHILLEPVDLLERLAACIPPPRFHLVRYHGILAPCAAWRDHVVPGSASQPLLGTPGAPPGEGQHARADLQRSRPLERDALVETRDAMESSSGARPSPPAGARVRDGHPAGASPTALPPTGSLRPRRLPWAALLQRVFAIDAFECPRCGGRLRLLAAIESPEAIRAILEWMGLPSRAPPLAPAEPEPKRQLGFDDLPLFGE
jgi:Putative transposase/Transposase zinc-binding domain